MLHEKKGEDVLFSLPKGKYKEGPFSSNEKAPSFPRWLIEEVGGKERKVPYFSRVGGGKRERSRRVRLRD